MGSISEWVKIVGIGAIVGLLGYQVFESPTPSVNSRTLPIDAPRSSSTEGGDREKQDLMRIVEAPLRGAFKFPDSVKVRWLKTEHKKLFSQAGLSVPPMDELEEWKMRGVYSAPTPMGLYGPFEKFFANVSVSRLDHALGGEVYFMNDGSWRRVWELSGTYSTNATDADLKKAGIEFCDDVSAIDKGAFKEFELGFSRVGLYDDLVKYAVDPKNKSYFESCLSEKNSMRDCRIYHKCVVNPDREKECKDGYQICTAGEPVKQCADKIVAAFKKRTDEEANKKKSNGQR